MADDQYPKNITLPDGTAVQLKRMTADDREAVLTFARALPAEDLMFLRVDITQEPVVDEWIANLGSGHSTSLLAIDDKAMIGYATVHRLKANWSRHVGELRVNVSPAYRGRGLGKILTSNIFDVARGQGLKKLMGNMTIDQKGAQAAFRRLGFMPEALLADYVIDPAGKTRDMIVMSYDVEGHTETMDEPLKL